MFSDRSQESVEIKPSEFQIPSSWTDRTVAAGAAACVKESEGGRVLLTEMRLPRIARLASNRSTGNCSSNLNKRISPKTRIEKFELEKLELRNLSSMRVSNRIIPPSEGSVRIPLRRWRLPPTKQSYLCYNRLLILRTFITFKLKYSML